MNRKWFVAISALLMLGLAVVIARMLQDPVPTAAPIRDMPLSGHTVGGPLEKEPLPPVLPPLPPASAMVMTSGDGIPPQNGEQTRAGDTSAEHPDLEKVEEGEQPRKSRPDQRESSAEQAETEPKPKKDKADTLVTRSSLSAEEEPAVTSATLTMDGELVTLRLTGSDALAGRAFILKDPYRVVLDLEGNWKIQPPRVPSNRMVRTLRVGEQGGNTRLVFDMRVRPGNAGLTQINAHTLELKIR